MNKKHGILIGIAFVLLFTGIALATSTTLSASSDVEIYAFDQNPAGSDEGNEWVTLYNPLNESVDIGNWILETVDGERKTIAEGTTLFVFTFYIYCCSPIHELCITKSTLNPLFSMTFRKFEYSIALNSS